MRGADPAQDSRRVVPDHPLHPRLIQCREIAELIARIVGWLLDFWIVVFAVLAVGMYALQEELKPLIYVLRRIPFVSLVRNEILAFTIFLFLRTLVPGRPAWWERSGPLWFLRAAEHRGTLLVTGVTGGISAAVALSAGFSLLHPITDYVAPLFLVAAALGGGLVLGLVSGGLLALLPQGRIAGRATAGALAALMAVAAWSRAGPTGWAYPSAASHGIVIVYGLLLFLVVGSGIRGSLFRGHRRSRMLAYGLLLSAALTVVFLPGRTLLPRTEEPAPGMPRAVLLVTVDTLRADHLGCYGYDRDTSPTINRLAANGTLFEYAFSPMPITDPSHVSILTGLHPRTTGVVFNGIPIARAETRTLADWFREHGYRTGAITSRAHLNPEDLKLSGFDTFSSPSKRGHSTEAAEALRRARGWFDRYGDEPFFLWVHFWDPHQPYAPPREPERSMFVDVTPTRGGAAGSTGEMAETVGLYDGEIRYADSHLGLLLEDFYSLVGRENALVVLTSDHGEAMLELSEEYDFRFNHGRVLARHQIHVPLIFSWPGRVMEGHRSLQAVSTASITPTITGLLGDPLPGEEPDVSRHLLPVAGKPWPAEPRPIFSERRLYLSPQESYLGAPEFSIWRDGFLYIVNPRRGKFLFDCLADPDGRQNLLKAEGPTSEALAEEVRKFRREHPRTPLDVNSFTEKKADSLRALGYLR